MDESGLARSFIMNKINYRIFALFVFIVLSWGLAWPINKIGLSYMSPLWYTAIRLVVATIAMTVIVISLKKFSLPRLHDLPLILTIGLLQIGVYILLTNLGLSYLPAGRASLLAYTTPLWIMPLAIVFFKEKPGPFKWIGFLLGLSGLVILMGLWKLDLSDNHILLGCAALLLASLSWAISMLCVRYMHWTKSPLELIPWQLTIGAIPVLCMAWIREPVMTVVWNYQLILSLTYTGFLVTGLSYWCGVIINKELPTILASLGFLAVPVFSLFISAIFLKESINLPSIVAIALILLGLIFVVVEKET
jgi:drug/metabolite transporter (DMT)-like permease